MTRLRLVLLATTALTAMQFASTLSHAQTAPLVVAQAKEELGPDGKPKAPPKEAPKAVPPAAPPPRPAPPAAPPPAAAPPPRPTPPPAAAPPHAAPPAPPAAAPAPAPPKAPAPARCAPGATPAARPARRHEANPSGLASSARSHGADANSAACPTGGREAIANDLANSSPDSPCAFTGTSRSRRRGYAAAYRTAAEQRSAANSQRRNHTRRSRRTDGAAARSRSVSAPSAADGRYADPGRAATCSSLGPHCSGSGATWPAPHG